MAFDGGSDRRNGIGSADCLRAVRAAGNHLIPVGENVSDRFEVDNTPPRIDSLAAQPRSRSVDASFVARDTYSPLKSAEYSLNAGEWKPLFPAEGTTDAREHRFTFRLENLEPGEHTLVVRVLDQFANPALAKITFTVK